MRTLLFTLFVLATLNAVAQGEWFKEEATRSLEKRIIVKSNLLSLVAGRPTLSVEKLFPNSLGAELCFVQGQFNSILFTDHYDYSGFLARIKKYSSDFDYGEIGSFLGAYIGNLRRNIETEGGRIGSSGYIGYPSRYFSANSIRAGGTFGCSYISKSRFVFEGLSSLGYGRYMNLDKSDQDTYMKGYLDMQVWLSVGYSF